MTSHWKKTLEFIIIIKIIFFMGFFAYNMFQFKMKNAIVKEVFHYNSNSIIGLELLQVNEKTNINSSSYEQILEQTGITH